MADNQIATTTLEQDKKTNNDRKLDILLELTQSVLALFLTLSVIYLAIKGMINEDVSNAFFVIIGFYFGKELKNKTISLGNSIRDISKKNV